LVGRKGLNIKYTATGLSFKRRVGRNRGPKVSRPKSACKPVRWKPVPWWQFSHSTASPANHTPGAKKDTDNVADNKASLREHAMKKKKAKKQKEPEDGND
jgi:hypothetical protein